MSESESRINKELFGLETRAMLPGLVKDYKDIKRENIIDQFVKVPNQQPYGLVTTNHHSLPHYK